jgi:hypothetical protein
MSVGKSIGRGDELANLLREIRDGAAHQLAAPNAESWIFNSSPALVVGLSFYPGSMMFPHSGAESGRMSGFSSQKTRLSA